MSEKTKDKDQETKILEEMIEKSQWNIEYHSKHLEEEKIRLQILLKKRKNG